MKTGLRCMLLIAALLACLNGVAEQTKEYVLDTIGMNERQIFRAIDTLVNKPMQYAGQRVRVGGYYMTEIVPCTCADHVHDMDGEADHRPVMESVSCLTYADPTSCCFEDGRVDLKMILSDEMAGQLPKQGQYFIVEGVISVTYRGIVAEGNLIVESITPLEHSVEEYISAFWE